MGVGEDMKLHEVMCVDPRVRDFSATSIILQSSRNASPTSNEKGTHRLGGSCGTRLEWLTVTIGVQLIRRAKRPSPRAPKCLVEVNGIRVLADVLPATNAFVAIREGHESHSRSSPRFL